MMLIIDYNNDDNNSNNRKLLNILKHILFFTDTQLLVITPHSINHIQANKQIEFQPPPCW